MALTLSIIALVATIWLALACMAAIRNDIGFGQAALFAPLYGLFGVDTRQLRETARPKGTVYVIGRRSRLDPAVMLCLLPPDTLHVLDDDAATAFWMEPYRSLARTVPFNPSHIFMSRRLVRMLRGNGRLAVYLPLGIDTGSRDFMLYRAVARIALKAGAQVVPVCGDKSPSSARPWSRLHLHAHPPRTITQLINADPEDNARPSMALFRHVAATCAGEPPATAEAVLEKASV